MSQFAAVGIDFGSSRSVVALAKKGGIEIVLNEASHRETPNIVGYGQKERAIGESGFVQWKSNFKNTINYFNRFLSIKSDAVLVANERKFLTCKVITNKQNKLGFKVNYKGKDIKLLPQQITASMLCKLEQMIQKSGVETKDMVISIPSYYTDQERKALLEAAKIADIKVLRLLTEDYAISLGYGIFRKAELSSTPKYTIFVDLGQSHLSLFSASFTKEKFILLCQLHERNLGVRNYDWEVLKFMSNHFEEQNGINPMESPKSKLKLLDQIEKQRKVLSTNSES